MKRLRLAAFCAPALIAVVWAAYLVRANVYNPSNLDENAASATAHHSAGAKTNSASANFGILSNATVSFGAWMTTPPFDRFGPDPNLRTANHHELIPQLALIKAGGTVNFIIAGFHNVIVYDDGKKPDDINTTLLIPPPPQGGPALINDPNGRIYRGLNPFTQSQDRVEVVLFDKPGTYLVICGVLPHFNEGMFGYVKVIK
jgi:plastocyanin